MLKFRQDVRLTGVCPQIVLAMQVAEGVCSKYGFDCDVTSINDGSHSLASFHWDGRAFDFATYAVGMTDAEADLVASILRMRLPDDEFDVVYGDENHMNHIHVEYQPKRG